MLTNHAIQLCNHPPTTPRLFSELVGIMCELQL